MKLTLRVLGSLFAAAGVVFLIVALVGGGSRARHTDAAAAKDGSLTCKWYAREKVISGAYKVYGIDDAPLWLAKTVFYNGTGQTLRDLKVRYKLGGYADWSAWQVHPAVVPTQTVVDLYHPILSSACAKLTSRTPAELRMEYQYTTADGQVKTDSRSERITVLGRNEFFYTDLTSEERTGSFQDFQTYSDLLAAWVTKADAPVAGLASLANERAGGVGSSSSDENCIKVLAHLYEILRTIRVTYQHPSAQYEQDKSFDIMLVQSIQYPRDTIQKRSGTCIDLAILLAAMMESVGIEPYLVSMDGHVFPMAKLPSGQFLSVEATCVGGGGRKSLGFEDAVKASAKTWKELQQTGRYVITDCRTCWGNGISPPELDPLPADVLERWGIVQLVRGAGRPVTPGPTGNGAASAGATVRLPANWSFSLTQPTGQQLAGVATAAVRGNQVQFTFTLQYPLAGPDGTTHQAREVNGFTGTITGRQITATCQPGMATWTLDGQPVQPTGLPFVLKLALSADGRAAQGTVTGATGLTVPIQMQAH